MRKQIITAGVLLSIATVQMMDATDAARADSTTQPAASTPAASTPAASTQATTTTASAPAITWDEAAKHVGETVTVTGPVVGTHITAKKQLILNIGKDYPYTGRFTIMMNPAENHTLLEDTYKGKTVSVTGKVILYKKAPEVICKSTEVTIEQ